MSGQDEMCGGELFEQFMQHHGVEQGIALGGTPLEHRDVSSRFCHRISDVQREGIQVVNKEHIACTPVFKRSSTD